MGKAVENKVIQVTGIGAKKDFSVLMTKVVSDVNMMEGGIQCFPRYIYEDTVSLKIKMITNPICLRILQKKVKVLAYNAVMPLRMRD